MENYSRDTSTLIMEAVSQALEKLHSKYQKMA
jgi:hypothetical protein